MQNTQVSRSTAYPMIILLFCLIAGMTVGYDIRLSIYVLGCLGITGFVILCIIKPFWAFCGLVLLGLTVWVSSVQLVDGISLMVGVGIVFLTIWLVRLLSQNITFVIIKDFWYLVGLAITIVISTLLNWDGPAGFSPVFTYVQLLLLTFLVVNFVTDCTRLRQLGHVFIIASALMAGLILSDEWGILPDGLIKFVQSYVYISNRFEAFERSGGVFGDPNFAALQLTIALPFIFEYWPDSSKQLKVWLFFAGLGILLAFPSTVSMSGLVGIVSMILIKSLLVRQRNVLLIIGRAILISLISFWLALRFLPIYYVDRITINLEQIIQFFQTYDKSLFLYLGTTRGDAWLATFKTFANSPIVGNGPGNAFFISPLYSVLGYSRPHLAAHNFLLSIASDLGLVGLFFFVGLLVSALWAVRPSGSKKPALKKLQPVGDAVFIALLACVVQGMALDLHVQKLLWILLGMGLAYKWLLSKNTNSVQPCELKSMSLFDQEST